MKYFKIKPTLLLVAILGLQACSVFENKEVVDPNSPSVESVLTNANASQLNQLGIGVQSAMRNGFPNLRLVAGSIGREVYNLSSTEVTWVTELLGTTNGGFNNNTGFNASYNDFSQTRRRAEIFQRSATNSTFITEAQKNGIRGFANTIQAWTMLKNINMQYKNGIRISFSDLSAPGDLLKPGPFVTYEAGLTEIKRLLDLGATQLDAAGTTPFAFTMTSGWAGFAIPSDFKKFNRAIAAEVCLYQKDWNGAATNIAPGSSFLNLAGPLTTGPVFTYSTTSGDLTNTSYKIKNDIASPVVAQAKFITDAEAGDTRVVTGTTAKVAKRTSDRSFSGLVGSYDVFMYASNISPVSIMRNEELILIYAEAQIQINTPASLALAVTALDAVRTGAGLPKLAVAKPAVIGNQALLITEMLNQRRYSLFYEGHRWFDMRRYDLLSTLPNDLPTSLVYTQLIRPFAEVQWDAKNPQ
jgi:hypothetical protein